MYLNYFKVGRMDVSIKSLILSTSIIALASSAQAADLDPVVSGYDWTGGYVGVSAGAARHRASYEDVDFDWFGSTHEYYSNGLALSLQGGYNIQNGPLVYGIEADVTYLTNDEDTLFSSDDIVNNQTDWMATLRGRAGLGLGPSYLYFTGGLAVANFERSWFEFDDPDDSWPDLGDTKVGVVAGFGIEHAIRSNWTLRAEVLAAKFGHNTSVNDGDYPMRIDDTILMARVGLNYRFGDPEATGGGSVEGTPYDFSGFYVGGGVGGHQAIVSGSDYNYEYYGSTYDHESNGLTGSVFAGYNWQNGALVLGLEGEVNYNGGDRNFVGEDGDTAWETGLEWSGSVKARAGVAAGNTLMYVLGGVAVGQYDDHFDYDIGDPTNDKYDMGGTYAGLIVGAGIEQAFTPNLTARVEATYTAYSGDTVFDSSGDGDGPYRGHAQDLALKAGLTYYFGDRGEMGSGALAPTVDWTGGYAGLDVIAAHHIGSTFDRVYYDHGGSYNVPSFGAGFGGHVGYDKQIDYFVYGIVADIAAYTNDEKDTAPNYREMVSSLNWMGTVRARAGLATGESLFYVTGGVAFADINSAYNYLPAPDNDSFDMSGTRVGWVAGLGVEHKVSERGSIKLEALYTGFAKESSGNPDGDICEDGFGPEPCEMDAFDSNATVKLSYSYRF